MCSKIAIIYRRVSALFFRRGRTCHLSLHCNLHMNALEEEAHKRERTLYLPQTPTISGKGALHSSGPNAERIQSMAVPRLQVRIISQYRRTVTYLPAGTIYGTTSMKYRSGQRLWIMKNAVRVPVRTADLLNVQRGKPDYPFPARSR